MTGEESYEIWYRRLWDYADRRLIDRRHGGWFALLDQDGHPKDVPGVSTGKPDLYHALQSCLVPLVAADVGLARGLATQRFRIV